MQPHPKKPKPNPRPPANARAAAQALLMAVLDARQTLDVALAAQPLALAGAEARFAMLLTLTTLQHVGQVDALLARYLDTPLPAKCSAVNHALRLGVVQLLLLDTPAHAVVNETVNLVKAGRQAGFAGLTNAVLQKLSRERPALPPATENLPAWLRAGWEAAYGAQAVAAMAEVASTRPPLDLNSAADMPGATRLDAQITRITGEHAGVEALPGYAEGAFFVQDVAASYPVRLLGDVGGLQVLDMCAAPGGKTMQLIQAGAFVTALDRSAARMKPFKQNMARMNMQANIVVADAHAWQPSRAYDAILLDAPCSATGTWRRHPEVVQLIRAEDVAKLVAIQRQLLARAWGWLKPGGKLVYCVCSLEEAEGEAQAAWFLGAHADAALLPVPATSEIPPACITPEGTLRTRPDMLAEHGGMDGFFAVCVVKRA